MTDPAQGTDKQEDLRDPTSPVQRNNTDPTLLHVKHKEVNGTFRITKPTFAVRGALARGRGAFLGAYPDPNPAADIDAEIFATVAAGFEEIPEGFDPASVVSFDLMEALFREVSAYWATFLKD